MKLLVLIMDIVIVLIDTWWNVNKIATSTTREILSFNRYMVECK